jgi:nucleotide-binding universal stress UspA family protein
MPSTIAKHGFRHILCPIDFSRYSRTALRYASALAEKADGQLTVLTANDPMLAAAAAAATHDPWHLDATTATELRRFVSGTLGMIGATATLKVVMGRPPDQIDRNAQLLKADLVVVGTQGLSGPKKWFLGSTTESLFRRSRVPVLAVPARGRGSLPPRPGLHRKTVLAPIDLDGTDRAEIRQIDDVAERLGANVRFLHVVKPTVLPSWLASKAVAVDRQRLEAARKRMRELVGRSLTRSRVVIGDPVEQIERTAVKERTSVIVMTLRRRGPLGPRRGSIAYRVVSSGVAAVLALPPPQKRSAR